MITGAIGLENVMYMVDTHRAFEHVYVVADHDQITAIDLNGEILLETTRPAPGIRYVGNGRPRGSRPRPSPKS